VFLFFLHLFSDTFFILKRKERGVIFNVHWSSCKVSVIIVILRKLKFVWQIFENIQTSNFIESHLLGVELLFADGRTGITKMIVVFAIFQMSLKISVEGSVLARMPTLFH